MPEFCSAIMTEAKFEDLDSWYVKQIHVLYALQGVEILSWVAGLLLIFLWQWREAKTRFISVLWTLITFDNIVLIAEVSVMVESNRAYNGGDYDKYYTLSNYYEQLWAVNQCLLTITHWTFAIKYLKIVQEFPLIFLPQDDNVCAKQRRLRCVVWSASGSYFTITGLWLLAFFLLVSYPLDESWDTNRAYYLLQIVFNTVIKVIPAVLLVFAVQKLRSQIRDLRGFSVREKLMCVHTVVFVCNICISLAFAVSCILQYKAQHALDWSQYCRTTISSQDLYTISQAINVVTLWLVIFMSLQLIKPLTSGWRDSVVSHLFEDFDPDRTTSSIESAAHRSAQRIHSATIEDINRQIRFLQALIVREDEGTESEASPLETLISLTSEERQILDDSVLTETSEEMFTRIRLEEARKMSINNDGSAPELAGD